MAISLSPIAASAGVVGLLLLTLFAPNVFSSDSIVTELSALQTQSPSGVIRLSDTLFRRINTLPAPRPFDFIIFFDAKQLHAKAELSLPALKSEFSLVSTSFQSNNPGAKTLFFFDIEFQDSQATFSLFGINSLPHIRLVPATGTDLKKDSIQMDASDFSRLAESMAEFIQSRTKHSVGPINRPPVVSKNQIFFSVAVLLICSPFFLKKLLSGNTVFHDKNVWMGGAIFIYFFSVSGAMFNIIRKMPMFMMDRQDPGKMVFFYKGSGMQLGAEGFTIGFLYTIVGLLLAFATHAMVLIKNKTAQRVMMIFVLFISFWAVKKVIFLDNWKTGYGIHGYWPSSWQ